MPTRYASFAFVALFAALSARADNAIQSLAPDKSKTLTVTWQDEAVDYVGITYKGLFGGSQKRFDIGDIATTSFVPGKVDVIWPRKGPYVVIFVQSRLGAANYFADTRPQYPRLIQLAEPDWPGAPTQPSPNDQQTPAIATEAAFTDYHTVTFEYDKSVGSETLKYNVTYDLAKGGEIKSATPVNSAPASQPPAKFDKK